MYLIVGLGNPGEQYIGTRHNLGFMIVDELRRKLNVGEWGFDKKFNAEIIQSNYTLDANHYTLVLARPQTYMNNSGMTVAKIAKFFKVKTENIVIVHDELDLPLGKIKVRSGGAAAGHHGVESIIESLSTDGFIRVRLGIGNTQGFLGEHKRASFGAEKFVMEQFHEDELSQVKHMAKQALVALKSLIEDGLEKTQRQFN